ncbi:MAG: sulfite exporter TauE/SafE family protein [Oscillospiraceae bacterium]|nr:sulfite exporter TauE/SafE family protein [Oscillospiraceae bacterium]
MFIQILTIIGYLALGFAVGTFGTLVGAGGGFLLTPVLLLLFPDMSPSAVTAVSMTTVLFNSASGSAAYARLKRIDFKTGLLFAVTVLPGTLIGTWLTTLVSRDLFNTIFGAFMLVFAAVIIIKSRMGDRSAPYGHPGRLRARRRLTASDGIEAAFSFHLPLGILISFGVGFLSGFLGIGGGIVHVPALVFLGFPAHFATATSHFVLACSSLSSFILHLAQGALSGHMVMAFVIAAGAVGGAQLGAHLSQKVKGSWIMILLAAALVLAGVRILVWG